LQFFKFPVEFTFITEQKIRVNTQSFTYQTKTDINLLV